MTTDHISWVISKLSSWKTTFEDEDNGAWENITELQINLDEGKCTRMDYDTILFHLWQSLGQEE